MEDRCLVRREKVGEVKEQFVRDVVDAWADTGAGMQVPGVLQEEKMDVSAINKVTSVPTRKLNTANSRAGQRTSQTFTGNRRSVTRSNTFCKLDTTSPDDAENIIH